MNNEKYFEIEYITPYFLRVTKVQIEDATGIVYTDDERKDIIRGWLNTDVDTYIDIQACVAEVRTYLSENVRRKRFPIPPGVTINCRYRYVHNTLKTYGYAISHGFIRPITSIVRKAKPTDEQKNRFRAQLAYRFKCLFAERFGIHFDSLVYTFNHESDLKVAHACHKLGFTLDDLIGDEDTFMTCFTTHKDTHVELMSIFKQEFASKFEQAKKA